MRAERRRCAPGWTTWWPPWCASSSVGPSLRAGRVEPVMHEMSMALEVCRMAEEQLGADGDRAGS